MPKTKKPKTTEYQYLYLGKREDFKGELFHAYVDVTDVENAFDFRWDVEHHEKWYKKSLLSYAGVGSVISVHIYKDEEDGRDTVMVSQTEFVRKWPDASALQSWVLESRALQTVRELKSKKKREMQTKLELDRVLLPVINAYKRTKSASARRAILAMVIETIVRGK